MAGNGLLVLQVSELVRAAEDPSMWFITIILLVKHCEDGGEKGNSWKTKKINCSHLIIFYYMQHYLTNQSPQGLVHTLEPLEDSHLHLEDLLCLFHRFQLHGDQLASHQVESFIYLSKAAAANFSHLQAVV